MKRLKKKKKKPSKYRLCGDRDETINYTIRECSKLAPKAYKIGTTKWARWSIGNCARNWSLTIRTNGICTNQNLSWIMRHKFLLDFEIQTDHLISPRRPDLIIINKKERTCRNVDFPVAADHGVKLKEFEKKDKYLDLARELKNQWNMEVTMIPIVIGALGTVTKGLVEGLEDLEIMGRVKTV